MSKGIEVTVNKMIEVSPEMIEQICESASYGGINYWADQLDWDNENRITVRENDLEAKVHTTSARVLAETLVSLWAGEHKVGDYIREYAVRAINDNDPGEVDAELADVIFQIALFGDIMYG